MRSPFRIINRSGTNEILLYGEIYADSERDFVEMLRSISPGPLVVRISSEGGDFFSGLAIYTALKRRGSIGVFIDSLAASAASVVAMAADAGKLVIAPEAFVFLHRARSSAQGEAKDFDTAAAQMRKFDESLVSAYRRSGQSDDVIRGWLDAGTWFSAPDAVGVGLADRIEEFDVLPTARAAVNLRKFGFGAVPAQVRAHFGQPESEEEVKTMSENAAVADLAADLESVRAAFLSAEMLGLSAKAVDDLVSAGVRPGDLSDRLIKAYAEGKKAEMGDINLRPSNNGMRIVSDERETLSSRIVEGLSARLSGIEPSASGREFYALPLAKLAEVASKSRLGEVRNEGGGHSSSDFQHLLGAAAGKSLQRSYEIQRSPLVKVCAVEPNLNTFMPVARISLEPGPELELVDESGEVTSGTIGDSKETLQLSQFARIFDLSRPAYLSDDLGGFSRMISEWGRVTASLEAKLIVEALTSKTMADGHPLFYSDHANLASSGTPISATTLEEGSLAMATATANGHVVGVAPKYLVTPAAKQFVALQNLTNITPATVEDVNVWAGALELLVAPHLDGSSATAWYLFADPNVAPVLMLGYYSGQRGPRLSTQEAFRHLAFSFRLQMDVGIGFCGTLGCWKNPGA